MKKRSGSQKRQKPTVKAKSTQERATTGMDLGDKTSRYGRQSNSSTEGRRILEFYATFWLGERIRSYAV